MSAEEKKTIHDICVDKTSCRHEMDKDGKDHAYPPTEQLTKDSIRKRYEEEQKMADNQKP